MSRDISCCECGTNMGVVRDAKLRKGINYLCENCKAGLDNLKRQVELLRVANAGKGTGFDGSYMDIFGDLFKGK